MVALSIQVGFRLAVYVAPPDYHHWYCYIPGCCGARPQMSSEMPQALNSQCHRGHQSCHSDTAAGTQTWGKAMLKYKAATRAEVPDPDDLVKATRNTDRVRQIHRHTFHLLPVALQHMPDIARSSLSSDAVTTVAPSSHSVTSYTGPAWPFSTCLTSSSRPRSEWCCPLTSSPRSPHPYIPKCMRLHPHSPSG